MARRMRRRNGRLIAAVGAALAAGALTGTASALPTDDEGGDETGVTQEQLDELLRKMQQLEEDNQRLHDEVDDLRATNDDTWLTEQRAEEIKGLVADVLADADTRSTFQNGLMAGWSDGFFLASPDGRFKLKLDGQLQIRWIYNYNPEPAGENDRHRQGFEVTRAKLTFSGHVFSPDMTYLIRMNPTRNEPGLVTGLYYIEDAWAQYRVTNNFAIRLGQFKLPFMREELVYSSYQQAVERSLVNENLGTGRTQGIEFIWSDETSRFSFAFSDGGSDNLGGFGNLAGTYPPYTNALVQDTEYSFTGRYEKLLAGEWRQFKDLTSPPGDQFGMLFGAAGHFQQLEWIRNIGSTRRDEHRWTSATGDISIEFGGANLFLSYVYMYVDHGSFGQIHAHGLLLQGGVYVTPKLELFSRWEYGWWDANFEFSDLNLITFGVNYYIDGHDLKWTTDIGFTLGPLDQNWYGGQNNDIAGYRINLSSNEPEIVFRTQFQLLF
jgi:hypothetical protein